MLFHLVNSLICVSVILKPIFNFDLIKNFKNCQQCAHLKILKFYSTNKNLHTQVQNFKKILGEI